MADSSQDHDHDQIKILVVDDSAVIRGFVRRFLETDPFLKVVSSVSNGEQAVKALERMDYDVIVLDIEMPVMDGLTALPLLLKINPNVQVIMSSTLTKENATVTFQALSMGAAECLAKPTTTSEISGGGSYRDSLVEKAFELGKVSRLKKGNPFVAEINRARVKKAHSSSVVAKKETKTIVLRPPNNLRKPQAIAIGSSTGGPQALLQVLSSLTDIEQPIFITQHMPPTFTTILAKNIHQKTGVSCYEAEDGMYVENKSIYVAPGDYHMTVEHSNGRYVLRLNQKEPENFCRPSVDPMMRSLCKVYGRKFLAVILTGMGQDGLKGCEKLAELGGNIIAQDEKSSVVWGMPGAVSLAGLCNDVVPLSQMASKIKTYAQGA